MRIVLLTSLLLLGGCPNPTQFEGSAKIGGPARCRTICRNWGMEMAGMIAMGEYSDACICRVRTAAPPKGDVTRPAQDSTTAPGAVTTSSFAGETDDEEEAFYAAAAAAAAGVEMQRRAAEAAASRNRGQPPPAGRR